MTVEASLVMPIVLTGIVFIIYLGFYLYNVCIIREVSYIAALRAGQQKELSNSQQKEFALEQLEQLLEERLLAARVIERDVKINSRKIKISVKADFKSPLFGMLPENMKIWTLQCEESASGINPVTIIRGVKKNNGS